MDDAALIGIHGLQRVAAARAGHLRADALCPRCQVCLALGAVMVAMCIRDRDVLVDELMAGPEAFKGKDPSDSFCGMWEDVYKRQSQACRRRTDVLP